MDLIQQFELLKNKKKHINRPGTVDIIFEIHKDYEKDERGFTPVFIKPTVEDKKIQRSLN